MCVDITISIVCWPFNGSAPVSGADGVICRTHVASFCHFYQLGQWLRLVGTIGNRSGPPAEVRHSASEAPEGRWLPAPRLGVLRKSVVHSGAPRLDEINVGLVLSAGPPGPAKQPVRWCIPVWRPPHKYSRSLRLDQWRWSPWSFAVLLSPWSPWSPWSPSSSCSS